MSRRMPPAALYPHWPVPARVRAFTSLRTGAGVSAPPFDSFNLGNQGPDGDDRRVVAANRAELVRRFGLPSLPHWLCQVHGVEVVRVTHSTPASPPPVADAAVTAAAGAVLAILSADCLPVLFAAGDGAEVGAAHAGWRGLAGGVLERTIAAMQTPPEMLLAWLGPAAGPRRYEVGQEVFDAFTGSDPSARAAFVPTRRGHWRADLYALARARLAAAGVRRVYGGGLCTIGDAGRFFSHRRDRRSGRMASLVWLQDDDCGASAGESEPASA